jgi:tetratricopeptide (TPR) repeat protein
MAPWQTHLLGSLFAIVACLQAQPVDKRATQQGTPPPVDAQPSALERARSLWQLGEREPAVELLTAALGPRGEPREALRQLADWCYQIHRLEQSLAALERLAEDPDRLRGRVLVRLHRYEEALAILTRASAAEVLARLEAQEALGLFQEWETELPAAADLLGADHPEVQRRRGRLALDAGRLDEAIACFSQTLVREPSNAPALFGLGQALVRSGREQEGLAKLAEHRRLVPLLDELEFAQRSLDLAPRHGPNWANLGDVQRRMGQPALALEAYTQALNRSTGAERVPIVLRAARTEEEDLRRPDLAQQRLELEIASLADQRLLVRASDVALRRGDLSSAEKHLQAALAQRPLEPALLQRQAALEQARSKPK